MRVGRRASKLAAPPASVTALKIAAMAVAGVVVGGLIVAVIYNGLQLLGLGSAAQNMWTAAVLLAAVTVDTLARRNQPST